MIIFPTGITLNQTEHSCLLHLVPDPELWITQAIAEKARLRRDALIQQWRPILFADETVSVLPANPDDLASLIFARNDYKTRVQRDAATDPTLKVPDFHRDRYNAIERPRVAVTLFPRGITISDFSAACILAYVQKIEEWVLGALLGQINRGKKKMITRYHPILMDDENVKTIPASAAGIVDLIVNRDDYQTLAG